MSIDARNALQRHFGYDQFRPGQEAVIDHLLAGHSTAAVFPTGAGKSLCYQLPALLLPGVTLVISPLIALMKDQIDSLTARCIAAARLDSTLNLDQYREVMERVRHGQLRLHQALDLAGRDGCQTAALGAHFAERMEAPCGHCQWCRGGKTEIPPRHTREIPEDIWPGVTQMVAENGEVLAQPRALSRFLCGIPSPKAGRARIGKHPLAGNLAQVPFRQVLEWVERNSVRK